MRSAVSAVLVAILAAVAAPVAHAQETRREIVTTENADYFGFDLRAEKDVTLDQCKQMCLDDPQCRAFTFNGRVNWCFLKSDFDEMGTFEGAVAGRVVEVAVEPDIGAPPALSFVPAGTMDQARAFQRRVRSTRSDGSLTTAEELVANGDEALGANDINSGVRNYVRALALEPDNLDIWLGLSRAATGWLKSQNQYEYRLQEVTTSAAINAYELTRTASRRAEALAVLAEALERRSLFRPALEAYKKSLELADSPQIADAYRQLREARGFRVTGHEVEADNTVPRICVQLSEELVKSGVDYSSYVAVDGKSAGAISASDRQICADGLEHGNSYRLTLRAGLPSSVGEVLERPVVINAYVRDRAPAVRFSGESFVLPQTARQGIPLVGINAEAADLELFRVGERSLARLLSSSRFLSQLEGYSVSDIGEQFGQALWQGTVELSRELNRETVTAVPLDQVIGDRQPGLYVLTAKVTGAEQDSWEPVATQWFLVSDIGLTTYAGTDGLSVFVRSLDTAEPLAGVELSLIARNNEILGTATSDTQGRAVLQPGLLRGSAGLAPQVLTARRAGGDREDFVFLDMSRAGFDLSDRGVEGREPPGPLDVFTYFDRGVYRPGETVHAVSLVRDEAARAGADLPLTMIVTRPDGKEAERIVSAAPSLGGHAVSIDLPDNAMRGVWHLQVHADPQAEPLVDSTFLVEDFIPDRIEFDLSTEAKSIAPGRPATVTVDGRFLYGAPAADLALEGELRLTTVRERAEAPGYQFGLADEDEEGTTFVPLGDLGRTDANGRAEFVAALGTPPATTRPLAAAVVVRLREDGGRAVERQITLPVVAEGAMIGIRPQFEDGTVAENSIARFLLIALDSAGQRVDLAGLNWSLSRINRSYQWYRDGSYWQYEAVEIPERVASGTVAARAGEPVEIEMPVAWGRYRLDVESPAADGPATSVSFEAGWYVEATTTETPDALEIALDQPSYDAGETARLKISPRFAGKALVVIGAEKLYRSFSLAVPAEGTEIDVPVGADWGAGAYVTVTLLRPGSAEATRLPARAIGTVWLKVNPGARQLDVALGLPDRIRPNGVLTVPVTVGGLAAGEEAYVTVAAVDVGILNLTRYTPPDPAEFYFGQRRLGLEIRDIYGRLIDGSAGEFGRIRSGGDGPGLTADGTPPTERLLALFSGIVRLDETGSASVEFEVPQFNGTARVMAVVWTRAGVGQADGDVIIRDPLVVSASLPKVLAPGDAARSVLEIHNTDGEAGAYELAVSGDDIVTIGELPGQIELARGERKVLSLSLAANAPGTSEITFTAWRDGEVVTSVARLLTVRPATAPVTNRMEFPLAAEGGSLRLDAGVLGDSFTEGARVDISVTRHKSFDVAGLLTRLDRYPYGCAEQTTSRALPLLYLSDLDAPAELLETPDLAKRVDDAIARVLTFQSGSGSFGLWGPGGGDLWLDAYVTDFLTRAREKGYSVPEQAMRLAVQNLQNTLAYESDIASDGDAIAYGLYVLARNRLASAGDLRYYADTRIAEFPTALSRAHLAAALSLYNEIERANRAFGSALELARDEAARGLARTDYGSPLRDGAAILALASETRPVTPLIPDMLKLVADEIATRRYTSTQEDAWLLLAARAAQESNRSILLEVGGNPFQGALSRSFDGAGIAADPLAIVNRTADPVTAIVTTLASPRQPLTAGGNGFTIDRAYYTLDGEEATLNEVRQNDRFVVVLTVDPDNDWPASIVVSDLLPGGFEIDNPRLVQSAELDAFAWLGEVEVAHTEFRSDRFIAALERGAGDEFSVAYVVRAVTPGTYVHPAASVEDMYRPELSARTATGFLEVRPAE
ncbi:MAG: membrane protein [Alphaproteobacteria bacterium]|nr:MAG: membrane protein [Alphaproteobacteria bacterium]